MSAARIVRIRAASRLDLWAPPTPPTRNVRTESTPTEKKPMNRTQPQQTDPAAFEKLQAIAKVLGVPPTDEAAIRGAFEKLFAPVETARAAARLLLTERERVKCEQRGVDPAKFLAMKSTWKR